MTDFESSARAAASRLDALGARYALVGGLAVSIRTEPRFTRDIDLVVAVDDDAGAEAVVNELVRSGWLLLAIVEQEAIGRLATARLAVASGNDIVDLLFASSGIEPEIAEAAEPIEVLPGFVLAVATVGHLIALKLLAADARTRPQDAGDLRALVGVATTSDLDAARTAIGLIEDRGFERGRDLTAALAALIDTR